MTDIFISYSSYDYLIAGILHDRLEAVGFKLWWDQRIVLGEPYKDEIMTALNNAKVVVVLWTPDSTNSEWVQKEAKRAIHLRKYVPLKYRCEQVPDEFRALQYKDITKWNSKSDHDDFRKLIDGIKEVIDARNERERHQTFKVQITGKDGKFRTEEVRPFKTFKDHDGPRLVVIPPGQFYMGAPDGADGERDAEPSERPQHLVRVQRPFAIGKYPVTLAEWNRARSRSDAIKHAPKNMGSDDDTPVTGVSWLDAITYIEWLSVATGQRYRLPTEAEWEYVCRARTKGPFAIPELSLRSARYDARGVYLDSKPSNKLLSRTELHPANVTACALNNFNVAGMHGNVWEWTQDHWHTDYSGDKPIDGTAWEDVGPGENRLHRVVRGGSYKSLPQHLRSAQRGHRHPRHRQPNVGFRVVRDLSLE